MVIGADLFKRQTDRMKFFEIYAIESALLQVDHQFVSESMQV
jgi:hypothetical protein